MLASLVISNVVLIEHLAIEFQTGLCALTGETGAGKSILLDSLGLALGARSDTGLVRQGAEQAGVTAMFDLPAEHRVFAVLKEQDVDTGTGPELILRRSIGKDGRSRAYINDQPVSVSLMKQVGETLVDIHGQFETQSLLNPKNHKTMLDGFAGIGNEVAVLSALWRDWKAKKEALKNARQAMEKARTQEAYLREALEDLDALSPEEGEEEKLTVLRSRLMQREKYREALAILDKSLADAENAMASGWRALERLGEDAAEIRAAMDRASAEIQEVLSAAASLSSDLEENEYALQEIDDRLFALKAQARKHGCAIDELQDVRADLARELNLIEGQDAALDDLIQNVENARRAYIGQAETISDCRKDAAQKLDALVSGELPPLKLEKARFETCVEAQGEDGWGPSGIDVVTFQVATNPNANPGPLSKIASGGEMARFMLALKVILAEAGLPETLVFDEVDSGIGGATADAVGERLAKLARHRQILVVTHSPQVAARAAHHWIVSKDGTRDVRTDVQELPDAARRREEIARMISGAKITDEARAAATKLLEGRVA